VVVACPLAGYAQYDIVPGSIREERTILSDGTPVQRQTFQIAPRRVVNYRTYVATLIRDDQTGLYWFTFEGVGTQPTQPGVQWKVAKSRDGHSLVGFLVDTSILAFRVSVLIATSMDSARSLAMKELSAEIAAGEVYPSPLSGINLNPHLDIAHFSGASGLSFADLRRVTATDDGWLVELASHPSVAKTAFVYLSQDSRVLQDFRVLKVEVRKN
jgi:hypothetical protein